VPLFTSGGLGLGLVTLVLVFGLKNLVLFTSLVTTAPQTPNAEGPEGSRDPLPLGKRIFNTSS